MAINNYEDKSDKTHASAVLLNKNNHYNSSIHCYYYSCFQLLKHFLIEVCNYTEQELNDKTKDKDSHNTIITLAKKYFIENGINSTTLFSCLMLVKKHRITADYKQKFVQKSEVEDVEKKTLYFINDIKKRL
ncbi:HEPN domain-containing protein [Elizabethkingia anophelis]|uniref:HEPN domain-containing protein n=1 Tax=Elizabethkingia TaxID=308865 RepID=UPI0007399F5B|nr:MULTISPECIES: HEPN domain-containing protein [Elizabethkingia]KUF46424.1 hypothetical protein AS358_14575 [Elizabethkingia anophelis]MCT3645160.1 HEPN domain-containing protein [Elizabethkingia anophelis]MCT3652967.1 HEPN domain-containing protein [Elizabethkingia anophelis]MCT3656163.1 HEPN domain-containing protein [Elizabethkingia anophelis]MCT3660211.1 HEPN domain-containing protein [Elizabethkingia anophelis]